MQACLFQPDMGGSGYPPCESSLECPGGFACLQNRCAPDCEGLWPVAWVEPDPQTDTGRYVCSSSWLCEESLEGGPSRLVVTLARGDFLELQPPEGEGDGKPPCERMLVRFSLVLVDPQGGRELSVVVHGDEAVGVMETSLGLEEADPEDPDEGFRENTHYYLIDVGSFGWPIRIRMLPFASNTTVRFAMRNFEMSCCGPAGT